MSIHDLKVSSHKRRTRVGRGIGSGHGKTAGRGTKGQKSRSGGSLPPYFEGGQNALVHRIPKQKGFKSMRAGVQIIHTDQLNQFSAAKTITLSDLAAAGLIRNSGEPVKLLQRGELKKAIKVEVHGASKAAKELVAKSKGTILKPTVKSQAVAKT